MSDVACRACVPFLRATEDAGHSIADLVEGLPYTVDYLEVPSNRITWDAFRTLLRRAHALLGGDEALARTGIDYAPSMRIMKALGANLVAPHSIYSVGATWYGPSIVSCSKATQETLPDGRLRQVITILDDYEPCREFFVTMSGVLMAAPTLIGLPTAKVEMEITEKQAVYTITLPPSMTIWRRITRYFSPSIELRDAIQELLIYSQELEQHREAERRISRRLARLNRFGQALARHTDGHELAAAVIELIEAQFNFENAALLVTGEASGKLEVAARRFETPGVPSAQHLLTIGDRVVGRLDLWEREPTHSEDAEPLLAELLPWIALALDNAHSFRELARKSEALAEEMSERKRAEQALHEAQRMEAVGRLAGGLAHDFNNVLTAIGGYASLIRDRLDPAEPIAEDAAEISAEVDRAAAIIKQVLAFSRRQMLLPRRIDLNATLSDLAEMIQRLAGETVQIELHLEPGLGLVVADAGEIEQIVINLVVNSLDAMPRGGSIRIETRNLAGGPGERDSVRLMVADTGVGMNEQTRERAVEPFYTTKPRGKGSGLGLSTVYGIVQQSGGSLEIESEPGVGTRISIELPRVAGTIADIAPDPGALEVPGGKETLLLVEDEARVREVTERILTGHGYRVLKAENGREAAALCDTCSERIDLLITDVVMPGMDGRELAKRALEIRDDVRGVVFLSGYANDDLDLDSIEARNPVFLRKPYSTAALLTAVRRVLDHS